MQNICTQLTIIKNLYPARLGKWHTACVVLVRDRRSIKKNINRVFRPLNPYRPDSATEPIALY